MYRKEQIYRRMENLYEELNKIKMLIDLVNNELNSAYDELYELEKRIEKETTAQ